MRIWLMDNSINILGSKDGFLSSMPKEPERANGILEESLSKTGHLSSLGHVTLNKIMTLNGHRQYFHHSKKKSR